MSDDRRERDVPFSAAVEPIGSAIEIVEAEREYVLAERDAFLRFGDAVRTLSVPADRTVGAIALSVVGTSDGRQLRDVRDRYRETVMATPDYEAQYGQPLSEHMASEFTEDVAAAVTAGNRFSEPLKRLLLQQARDAARQRETFLDVLEEERDALTDAYRRLRGTTSGLDGTTEFELLREPFAELVDREHDLRRDASRCERLLWDRQREIHGQHRRHPRVDDLLVQEYLYERLDVTFPVLSATLDRLRELRRGRRAVTRAITRRY